MANRSYQQQQPLLQQKRSKGEEDSNGNDLVNWGKKFFKDTSQEFRLKFAVDFFFDAMQERGYKISIENINRISGINKQKWDKWRVKIYRFQTSNYWRYFLVFLSYVMMYLIHFSCQKPTATQFYLEVFILLILWFNLVIQRFHRYLIFGIVFQTHFSKFYLRFLTVLLLTVDQILTMVRQDNTMRPFLVLRCALPLFFDISSRKKTRSIMKLWKVLLIYMIIFHFVVLIFTVITNAILQHYQPKEQLDQMTQKFYQFTPSFILWNVLSSHEAFPDYQMKIMRKSPQFLILCVVYIFLNAHVFLVIPSGIFYFELKQKYSQQILLDELNQQHSLVFVFIALSNEQNKLTRTKLIQFLFRIYQNRVQSIGFITNICLRINHYQTQYIEVSQFINLCKIIRSDRSMIPSYFHQWPIWRQFRNYCNYQLGFKAIVQSSKFTFIVTFLIVLSIVNSLIAFYYKTPLFIYIDNGFTIIMKIICIGVQRFFNDTFHRLDFILVFIMLIFQIFSSLLDSYSFDQVLKMARFYRVPIFGKQLASRYQFINQNSLDVQFARLTNQLMIIIPIIFGFLPFYFISGYVLGILGMWMFRQPMPKQTLQSPYGKFEQFSNFRNFTYTQFMYLQNLVEAGWSTILFHYVYNYGYTFIIIFYFMFCHVIAAAFIQNIIRAIVWQIYETVHDELNIESTRMLNKQIKDEDFNKKRQNLMSLEEQINKDNRIHNIQIFKSKRNLESQRVMETSIDIAIIRYIRSQMKSRGKNNKLNYGPYHKIIVDQIEQKQLYNQSQQHKYRDTLQNIHRQQKLQEFQQLFEEDIDLVIDKLSKKINISGFKYPLDPYSKQFFQNYLAAKLIKANSGQMWFDKQNNTYGNQQTIQKLVYQLNEELNIRQDRRRKIVRNIRDVLIQNGANVIEEQFEKQHIYFRGQSLNYDWVLRQTFMAGTSEFSIKKFYLQKMSKTYPNYFNQIIQMKLLQPLLRLEARALYALRNIVRYRQIQFKQFFNILLGVQNILSQKVLRKGSIFKFLFKLQSGFDYWFTVQQTHYKQYNLRFIKNGVWLWNQNLKQEVIYSIKDVFSNKSFSIYEKQMGTRLLKMLFQNFQTIAMSLKCRQQFFKLQPNANIYDAYLLYKDFKNESLIWNQMRISKIMAVILANSGERTDILDYNLTDVERVVNNSQNIQEIGKDDKDNQQYEQQKQEIEEDDLKKKQTAEQQITVNKGIPYIFIINLLNEIKDALKTGGDNFGYQVQKLLNFNMSEQ